MRPDRKGIKTHLEGSFKVPFLVEMRPDRKGIKTPYHHFSRQTRMG